MINNKEKIVVLGGGIASITAAFALTNRPDWKDKYDITIYQLGWRLGGKCASGRNEKMGQRIEEHGLHVWFGFYENAFKYMQQCYQELDRPMGAPLRTWEEAFKKHNYIVTTQHIDDTYIKWPVNFPTNDEIPGQYKQELDFSKVIKSLYSFIQAGLADLNNSIKADKENLITRIEHKGFISCVESLKSRLADDFSIGTNNVVTTISGLIKLFEILLKDITNFDIEDHKLIKHLYTEINLWIDKVPPELLPDKIETHRKCILLNLSFTILHGMTKDKIIYDVYKINNKKFDDINDIELKCWLSRHGATDYTINSSLVRAFYDLSFAYKNGESEQANIEAGTALRAMLRLFLNYKGAIIWKMQAGMGDTVFTPYYQVLKKRGVNFKFFHEVNELTLDPDNKSIVDKISLTRQVELNNDLQCYDPLVTVKDLKCWPSKPLYKQIAPEQAELLQEFSINLENFWTNWPKVFNEKTGKSLPKITLEKGKDFDSIVFGIPVASLPYTCPELLENSAALKAAHQNVNTVVTQAYQLWTTTNLQGLGIDKSVAQKEPMLSGWTQPIETWAAMNQLINREDWSTPPQNIAYFCGVQKDVSQIPLPRSDLNFQTQAKASTKNSAIDQLNHQIYTIWPKAADSEQFRWDILFDQEDSPTGLAQIGEARFNSQYWRSNVSPTERYTLSVVGSSKFRIDTQVKEFSNIYFTGDWIKNGLNTGCVEAATMAGLQTSRAISGYPEKIFGDKAVED